jgi:hypothetical protein
LEDFIFNIVQVKGRWQDIHLIHFVLAKQLLPIFTGKHIECPCHSQGVREVIGDGTVGDFSNLKAYYEGIVGIHLGDFALFELVKICKCSFVAIVALLTVNYAFIVDKVVVFVVKSVTHHTANLLFQLLF